MEVKQILPLLFKKIKEGLTISDSCKVLGINTVTLYRTLDPYQKKELLAVSRIALPKKYFGKKRFINEFSTYRTLALDREDLYFDEDED